MEQTENQKELIGRFTLLGFTLNEDLCAMKPTLPGDTAGRQLRFPLGEYLEKLRADDVSVDDLWDDICLAYVQFARPYGTVVKSVEETPLVAAINKKNLGEIGFETLEYLIDYNHRLLDKILLSGEKDTRKAWLNLYLYIEQTTQKASVMFEEKTEYLKLIRTGQPVVSEDTAERECFTFPYFTALPLGDSDKYIDDFLNRRQTWSVPNITEGLDTPF